MAPRGRKGWQTMKHPIRYRGYVIQKSTCGSSPFPWEFFHEDYDGAPEDSEGPPADHRCGDGKTIEDCCESIDFQYEFARERLLRVIQGGSESEAAAARSMLALLEEGGAA